MLFRSLKKKQETSTAFDLNWKNVEQYSDPVIRYHALGSKADKDAKELLESLEDLENGVFTWIKSLWT